MAATIVAGDDAKRGDQWFVDPYKVIVKEELRGRFKPPTEQQIIELAVSMMDNGQQQAVQVRKLKSNEIQLNLGFTRTAAARLIRAGFTDLEGVFRQDENFKLKVVVSDANDEQAFRNNIVENAHRNQTSPIDDAHNQHRLRERYGMEDGDITKLYRYGDPNKVARLRRLLQLPRPLQDRVHEYAVTEGKSGLPVAAALDLLDLPEAKQAEAIAKATKDSGLVVAAAIKAQVRDHHLSDDAGQSLPSGAPATAGANGTPAPKGYMGRSLSEFRKFLAAMSEGENEKDKELAKVMSLWLAGKRKDEYLLNAFAVHRGAK